MRIRHTHTFSCRKEGTIYLDWLKGGYIGYYVPLAETSAAQFNLNLEIDRIITPRYGQTIYYPTLKAEWLKLYPKKAEGRDPEADLSRRIAYLENMGFLKKHENTRGDQRVWDVQKIDLNQYKVEPKGGIQFKEIDTLVEQRRRKAKADERAKVGAAMAARRSAKPASKGEPKTFSEEIELRLEQIAQQRLELDAEEAKLRKALEVLTA